MAIVGSLKLLIQKFSINFCNKYTLGFIYIKRREEQEGKGEGLSIKRDI